VTGMFGWGLATCDGRLQTIEQLKGTWLIWGLGVHCTRPLLVLGDLACVRITQLDETWNEGPSMHVCQATNGHDEARACCAWFEHGGTILPKDCQMGACHRTVLASRGRQWARWVGRLQILANWVETGLFLLADLVDNPDAAATQDRSF
jgi:hypothetical protein